MAVMKIKARIKPGSKHIESVTLVDGIYEVRVKAPAIEGRANVAAIELLAQYFGVPKSRVRLLGGATSRYKLFEIG